MVAKTRRQPGFYELGTRPITWKRSRLWQARLWIGTEHGGEVSLGLHPSERSAHLFWEEVRRLLRTCPEFDAAPIALAVWECCRLASAARGRDWRQLPKWVSEHTVDGETSYIASGTIRGELIEVAPCSTPCEAFLAFWELAGPMLSRKQLAFV